MFCYTPFFGNYLVLRLLAFLFITRVVCVCVCCANARTYAEDDAPRVRKRTHWPPSDDRQVRLGRTHDTASQQLGRYMLVWSRHRACVVDDQLGQ